MGLLQIHVVFVVFVCLFIVPSISTAVLNALALNPLIPDSAKSKSDKFQKLDNWGKLKKSTAQQLSNEWSHFRILSLESKLRKLCITQGFTLGVKGLTNSTTVKYCSTGFQGMVTL